jgi:hypothetical protein
MNAGDHPQPRTRASGPGPRRAAGAELDDPCLAELLDDYLAAGRAGQRPNREAFLARALTGLRRLLDGEMP